MAEKSDKEFKLEAEQNGEKQPRADAGEWIEAFLTILRTTANVHMSCRHAGVSRKTAYKWREENKEFSELWDDAVEDGLDLLEYSMFRRGIATSDRAAEFLLKVKRYKDALKLEHSGPGGGPIPVSADVVSIMDTDDDDDDKVCGDD
jgi:hypothetical protein